MSTWRRPLAVSALTLLLPACNSGGGNGSTGTTVPPPPADAVVNAKTERRFTSDEEPLTAKRANFGLALTAAPAPTRART